MTKKRIWLMILTAFVISVVIVFGSMTTIITNPKSMAQEQYTETSSENTQINFVIRIWNNHLGLFRGDSDTPYREIDMPIYLLTEHDREMLKEGITAQTEDELRRLVEDITS